MDGYVKDYIEINVIESSTGQMLLEQYMCCNQSLYYASVVCSPSFPSWCRSLALQIDAWLQPQNDVM